MPERPNAHEFGGGRPPGTGPAGAIFFRLRAGRRWEAPGATGTCPGSAAHDSFREWARAGVLLKLWGAGLSEYGDLKGIDWSCWRWTGA